MSVLHLQISLYYYVCSTTYAVSSFQHPSTSLKACAIIDFQPSPSPHPRGSPFSRLSPPTFATYPGWQAAPLPKIVIPLQSGTASSHVCTPQIRVPNRTPSRLRSLFQRCNVTQSREAISETRLRNGPITTAKGRVYLVQDYIGRYFSANTVASYLSARTAWDVLSSDVIAPPELRSAPVTALLFTIRGQPAGVSQRGGYRSTGSVMGISRACGGGWEASWVMFP